MLDRLKEQARTNNQFTYLMQAMFFEKKIEALHITRSMQDRADSLAQESNEVIDRLQSITICPIFRCNLYSWYIRNGHARNEKDAAAVEHYFIQHFPADAAAERLL